MAKGNYCRGVVICHGKSEWNMARFISSNLHLHIKTYAMDSGRHSIQITDLKTLLNTKPFKTRSSFLSEYPVEEQREGRIKKLKDFKLFMIMDTDDCTEQQSEDYKTKKMFEGHWLYEYIVPIANEPCLEDVLVEAGMMPRKIPNREKGSYYASVFPINTKPLSDDTLQEVKTLKSYIQKSNNTNLSEFIDYCLGLLPQ